MGGKRHKCCKVCQLEFNDDNKHLFPVENTH